MIVSLCARRGSAAKRQAEASGVCLMVWGVGVKVASEEGLCAMTSGGAAGAKSDDLKHRICSISLLSHRFCRKPVPTFRARCSKLKTSHQPNQSRYGQPVDVPHLIVESQQVVPVALSARRFRGSEVSSNGRSNSLFSWMHFCAWIAMVKDLPLCG